MRSLRRRPERKIPMYTLEGVQDADISTHWIQTEDGLGLSLMRFLRKPGEDVVMIVHGLTTSTDMFIMPEHENLVSYLLNNGFGEVWCFDYRMSNRHGYNLWPHRFNMDDIALFDFPPALEKVKEVAGDRRIHVITHCLGAVSFAMALFGGTLRGVASAIFNSASLRPKVPAWSRLKLWTGPFVVERLLGQPYISARWAEDPWWDLRGLASRGASLVHWENDIPSCHMLSLMWGAGFPAVYVQENLKPETHERSADLYGGTGMHYYRHVRAMVEAGNRAVKLEPNNPRYDRLPDDYLARAPEVNVPVLFCTGSNNRIFLDSNVLAYQTLDALVPGRHSLKVFAGYGHQDVFMGKDVAQDIFPSFLSFLEHQRRTVVTSIGPIKAA